MYKDDRFWLAASQCCKGFSAKGDVPTRQHHAES
jgi:hypothetical protein